ncbi:MAG: ABC transporter permease [Candidatus Krumholzibacteriota bacterium]|nr:ABC transporter permease [Candidatus Krumholzibacteriota bacterium]
MRKIFSIALNTFREALREKLLFIVLIFTGILLLSTYVLSPLSVGTARNKVITDVGLACISLLGVLTAIMVGSTLVYKEVDKKAILMVLSRPVSRHGYLIGKYAGITAALFLMMILMTGILAVMIELGQGHITPAVLLAIYLSGLETMVLCAIVIFFSTFTTPVLTSFFSLCLFIAGSLSGDLRAFASRFGGALMKYVMDVLYYLLPNLKVFNLRHEAVHQLRFSSADLGTATLYALVYTGVILYFAYMVFRKREFS